MVLTTVIVTNSDPTDPTIYLERKYRELVEQKGVKNVTFDESKFRFYCNICDSYILKNTKHWLRCNRCCFEFDHHCQWVSNDIGLHNYAFFIRMLIFVFVTALTQASLSVYAITYSLQTNRDTLGFITTTSFLALNWATLVIAIFALIFAAHLLLFHY